MSKSFSSYFENGSIVDIIAPSSLCELKEIKQSIEYVKLLGLTPRYNKQLLIKPKALLCSQTVLQKEAEFKKVLQLKDSNIIWCLRGGYGSLKLLPFLSKLKKPKKKKILIGYSDITALHYFFNQKWKWPSLHFSGIAELSTFFYKNKQHRKGYVKLLSAMSKGVVEYKNLTLLNAEVFKKQNVKQLGIKKIKNTFTIKSVVVGGNLCTLTSLLGAKYLQSSKISVPSFSSILFLEDVNEPAYKIDRMLYQLKLAGYFKNIKAIVFGDLTEGSLEKNKIKGILLEFAKSLQVPVVCGLKVGHGELNSPLPLMSSAELNFNLTQKKVNLFVRLCSNEK